MLNLRTIGSSYYNNNTNNADNDLSISPTTALAQTIDNNKTQLWIDKENNAKIIFTYKPKQSYRTFI
jgi:hypothetical protein